MSIMCPICESFDVYKNENGDRVCFTCLNIQSTDDLNDISAKKITPPPFPETMERRKVRRTSRKISSASLKTSSFIKGVV